MRTVTISFWLRRSQKNKKGESPIYCRISYSGKERADFATGYSLPESDWITHIAQARKSNPKAGIINKALPVTEAKLIAIEANLLARGEPVAADLIRNLYLGVDPGNNRSLLEAIDEHNRDFRRRVDRGEKGHSEGTMGKYNRLRKAVAAFLRHRYNRRDISLAKLDYGVIDALVVYLQEEKKIDPVTIKSSYYAKLNKIIKIAVKRGYITKNPFEEYNLDVVEKERVKLTEEEVFRIVNKRFDIERMERIRERAVFAIFTGMAFGDTDSFTVDDIEVDINGNRMIVKDRHKTGIDAIVPIYPEVEAILEKYLPTAGERGGRVFPRISNQKMNTYVRELADLCGINKHVTTHTFRHTFGQMHINAGVSLDSTSRMMGHASIRTTAKSYVRIGKERVLLEKDVLSKSLDRFRDKPADQTRQAK